MVDRLIQAYRISSRVPMDIVPSPVTRVWMDETPKKFAYRCLPLNMANQIGWQLVLKHKIKATWTGGCEVEDLQVEKLDGPDPSPAFSHFGSGVLTFTVPWLFRTPPGWDLYVKGPANQRGKPCISPLEGLCETDWMPYSFTMNWIFSAPGEAIFAIDEVIGTLIPMKRGELEEFSGEIHTLSEDPELKRQYDQWQVSRKNFNIGLRVDLSDASLQGWQKDYMHGADMDGKIFAEHRTNLKMKPFVDGSQKK